MVLTALIFTSQVDAACERDRSTYIQKRKLSFICKSLTASDHCKIDYGNGKTIETNYTQIRQVTATDFEHYFNDLEDLTYSDCGVKEIADLAFEKLQCLKEFDLKGSTLKRIKASWFRNTVFLRRLTISNSWIESIDKQAFDTLTKIYFIDLSQNNLTTIQTSYFQKTVDLRILDLRNNDIVNIEAGAFSKLTNLAALYLDNNKLKRVEAGLFGKVVGSISISLDNNLISSIDKNAFGIPTIITM